MTQTWSSDNGTLKVWPHTRDPDIDPPVGETSGWDESWPSGGAPDEAEALLLDWLMAQALPNDISYKDAIRVLVDTRADNWTKY